MILDFVLSEFGMHRDELRKGRRTGARLIFAWLARRSRASSFREIGDVLSLSSPGVSHLLSAAEDRIRCDRRFEQMIRKLQASIESK